MMAFLSHSGVGLRVGTNKNDYHGTFARHSAQESGERV